MMGVDMTPFFAILGGLSVAIGFALKESLGNVAAGVFILFFKPFKVGDFVESNGVSGTVHEIQIMNTILITPDNKHILIPNGAISNSVIVNYSRETTRRLTLVYGVSYESDMNKVKELLQQIIDADERVLRDPASAIVMSELADSSVNFSVKIWLNASNYWSVKFEMNEKVFEVFNANGINIPYPQMDVHINQTQA
jgi:small conductance mechanosensitive channel